LRRRYVVRRTLSVFECLWRARGVSDPVAPAPYYYVTPCLSLTQAPSYGFPGRAPQRNLKSPRDGLRKRYKRLADVSAPSRKKKRLFAGDIWVPRPEYSEHAARLKHYRNGARRHEDVAILTYGGANDFVVHYIYAHANRTKKKNLRTVRAKNIYLFYRHTFDIYVWWRRWICRIKPRGYRRPSPFDNVTDNALRHHFA